MAEDRCEVHATIEYISTALESGQVNQSKERRIAGDISTLLDEIATGKAGDDHLSHIDILLTELNDSSDPSAVSELGQYLAQQLKDHKETFKSHVESCNCPTGDCDKLTPSPCQMACPAGIDIPTYLTLIANGEDARAIEVIRRDNPLPWVCGLVCTRPCELVCERAKIDAPISIKYLKAYSAKKLYEENSYINPPRQPLKNKKVCVIGAGPGGLSAAYYLGMMGYTVKVIEALPVPGGMITVGIPRYRLPMEVIKQEVKLIEDLGVEFCYNTRFGTDITLEDLKNDGFEAFFIAIGAHKSWNLGIKGEKDFPNVLDAVVYLRRLGLEDYTKPGDKVVVIGGGNVAIDAARSSLRLGAEKVTIAYRRSRKEMPADAEEIEHAMEEGIEFKFLCIPEKVAGQGDQITSLDCIQAELVKKEGSDRMSPVPIEGSNFSIEADTVISAIGQFVDQTGFEVFEEVKWSRRGTIEVNPASMASDMPGVFAAGDAVTGPATVIEAIGGGKRAAEAIDRYFNNMPQPALPKVPVRHAWIPPVEMPADAKMTIQRPQMQMAGMEKRCSTFEQAELGYDEQSVRQEASRCLRCDICQRCAKCVDVCKTGMNIEALQFNYMDKADVDQADFRVTKESCILCGACAANCENNAIILEEKGGERQLKLCGTVLNKQKMEFCEMCDAPLPSVEYRQYIAGKLGDMPAKRNGQLLCDACLRKKAAVSHTVLPPV